MDGQDWMNEVQAKAAEDLMTEGRPESVELFACPEHCILRLALPDGQPPIYWLIDEEGKSQRALVV